MRVRHEPARSSRRLTGGLVALGLAAMVLVVAGPAQAQDSTADAPTLGGIDVVQVEGLLDPPNASLITDSIDDARSRGASLLVFQLDSSGAVDIDVDALVDRIRSSEVPVAVWVGPSGANARGGAALVALAAPWVAVSQGSGIGGVEPVRLDRPGADADAELATRVGALLEARPGRDPSAAAAAVAGRLPAARADDLGVVDDVQPTVGDLIVSLDGRTLATPSGSVTLSTAAVVDTDAGPRQQPNQEVRFHKLELWNQVLHTLGAPWVAYLLLVTGLLLLVFEFYTASIGLAGAVGGAALVGSFVGFSHLPVQWWAVALVALGVFGFTVDLQAGGLGVWTGIGGVALVAGSVTLYGGSSRLDPAWWVVVGVCGGAAVFMIGAMTAMVRSRFSTPTIGREGMIGDLGTAEVAVAPDGVVRVRDALWRARTNRATPITAGGSVRVVAVDGVVLEVEPEEGGARDYRDRRTS